MSASMLEGSPSGVGTALRLEKGESSMAKRLRLAANEHALPPPLPPRGN